MEKVTLFFIVFFISLKITTAQKPELWGMTAQGGVQDYGVVFKINGDGTGFWKVHDFTVKNPGFSPKNMSPLLYQGWLYGVTTVGGMSQGVLFKYYPPENHYVPVHFFSEEEGDYLSGSLMLASNGKMYGVARNGGDSNSSTLYEFDPITEQVLVKFNFNVPTGSLPTGKLLEKDGYLYGVATEGGLAAYFGVLFRYQLSTTIYQVIHSFSLADANPYGDLLLASDEKIYGSTSSGGSNNGGTLFSFDPADNSFAIVHYFDGASDGYNINGNLIGVTDGKIAGTASNGGLHNGGTIFEYNIVNGIFNILYQFGANGQYFKQPGPYLKIHSDGWVYGTTLYEDSVIIPSVFRFYPDSTVPEVLAQLIPQDFNSYYMTPTSGLADYGDGWLYSAAENGGYSLGGSLYRFNTISFEIEKLTDLNESICLNPFGSLTVSPNGKLYAVGGNSDYSFFYGSFNYNHPEPAFQYSMFEIDPLTAGFRKIVPEKWDDFGYYGYNSLTTATDQQLYGISADDGARVFRYDPVNDTAEVLLTISKFDIGSVYGDLIQADNGKFYGLSTNGGNDSENPNGLIFEIDPLNKTFKNVFDFDDGVSGDAPKGSLLQADDGLLYGMTKHGTNDDVAGTIFSYEIATGTFKKLFEFTDTLKGKYPLSNLIETADGYLYGMTSDGGNFGYGVIFRFNKTTNQLTKLWDFDGELAGGNPQGSLLQASNGEMYGMTVRGGLNEKGVIFAFNPEALLYEVIENFTVNEKGALPYGNLVEYHGPASVIYTMPDTVVCAGTDFTLLAIATGGYLFHTWYHDGVELGGNAKGLQLNPVTSADTGKYWCVIYNDLDTVVSDTIHLQVVDPVEITLITLGQDTLCLYDEPVELLGTPSGGFYSGTGVNGNYFDPSAAGVGTHIVYYTYTDECASSSNISITVEICSGVNTPSNIDFKTNPNPFSDVMKVIVPEEMQHTNSHFRLINQFGNTLQEGKVTSPDFFIHRNQLAAGMYLLVIDSDAKRMSKKVVIE